MNLSLAGTRLKSMSASAIVVLAGLSVTACSHVAPAVRASDPNAIAINADYTAGLIGSTDEHVPSIDELINRVPSKTATRSDNEDKLRTPAMRDAALSYGAQGGLAWEMRAINQMLGQKASEISRIFDFQRLMIKGPDNVMILPPVISEANETWESSEAGKTLRVADTVYEIIEQARFAPNAPLWQTYLTRSYTSPAAPPDVLLPRDNSERAAWTAAVTEGWEMGRQQAQDIFQLDLERLERDYKGMVLYKALLEEGKVSAPVVADARLGTTGTGQDMRVNDRAVRITQDPTLQVGNEQSFDASPTTAYPDGQTTGNNVSAPRPDCPANMAKVKTQISTQLVCAPFPSMRPVTTVTDGRAAWSTGSF